MKAGHYKVAERYILYRAERALPARGIGAPPRRPSRRRAADHGASRPTARASSGTASTSRKRIEFASIGLDLCLDRRRDRGGAPPLALRRDHPRRPAAAPSSSTRKTLIEKDADFAKFAAASSSPTSTRRSSAGTSSATASARCRTPTVAAFRPLLEHGIAIKRLDPQLLDYDLDRARRRARPDRRPRVRLPRRPDALRPLPDRRQDRRSTARRIETPQFFWMRVAMGLFLDEKSDREDWAHRASTSSTRAAASARRTPTLFNSGTLALAALVLLPLHTSTTPSSRIMQRGIAENAYLSKWAGGLGGSWTAVRGTGAHIARHQRRVARASSRSSSSTTTSSSPSTRAASAAAPAAPTSRPGTTTSSTSSSCARNTGDDRRRTHDMNTANWIPDLFMKRMEAREHWTLFRANEVPDLHELYGRAFEERYLDYEQLAAARARSTASKIEALELWKKMLTMLFETGHPVDHLQGPVQRPHPAGPRRRHPLSQPLHRDHAQHERRRDRRLQPRLRSSSTRTSTADGSLDHDEAPRDHPRSPCARSTTSSTSTSTRPRPPSAPTCATARSASA